MSRTGVEIELTGLWTIVTSCDLNVLCRRSEMPLMYGTEAYTLFSLRDSLDSLVSDSELSEFSKLA